MHLTDTLVFIIEKRDFNTLYNDVGILSPQILSIKDSSLNEKNMMSKIKNQLK